MKPLGPRKFTIAPEGIAKIRTEFHGFMVGIFCRARFRVALTTRSFSGRSGVGPQVDQQTVERRREMRCFGDHNVQTADPRVGRDQAVRLQGYFEAKVSR